MVSYPSGLRGQSAKLLFIGSNPIDTSRESKKQIRGNSDKTVISAAAVSNPIDTSQRPEMYYTYVLKSKKDNKLYVGQTSNLLRRIIDHNLGLVKSTKHRKPLIKVYHETFNTRSEAMKREKFLKTGIGREFLNSIIKS
jgi:putative endonuclease